MGVVIFFKTIVGPVVVVVDGHDVLPVDRVHVGHVVSGGGRIVEVRGRRCCLWRWWKVGRHHC